MNKEELKNGECYASIADGNSSSSNSLYIGRRINKNSWNSICVPDRSFSMGYSDLENSNFKEYRPLALQEMQWLEDCEKAGKYVDPPKIDTLQLIEIY